MLGYEPLEDMEPAPLPERDAQTPPSEDASAIEAAPVPPESRYAASVMGDQPSAYYRFESGDLAREHAGRAPLSVKGTPAVVRGALANDGSTQLSLANAWLQLPILPQALSGSQTIEAWLSVTATKERPATWLLFGRPDMAKVVGIEGRVEGGAEGGGIFGSKMRLLAPGSADNVPGTLIETPFAATPPASVHVVVVLERGKTSLWVGGELRGSGVLDKPDTAAGEAAATIIGAAAQAPAGVPTSGGLTPSWNGTLDELAIYPHALAPARIEEHNAIGTGKK